MAHKLEVITLPIEQIKEYENNVKIHTPEQVEQVKKSIVEFGNCDPVAVDENYVLIEGHGRVMAMRELGFSEVQAIVLSHLTEDQKKAYRLVHNKLTMNTGFDLEALETELGEISLDSGLSMDEFDFELPESIDMDSFFEDSKPEPQKEKEPERVQCPHCGEWFEVD